jgi:hypothetical protein
MKSPRTRRGLENSQGDGAPYVKPELAESNKQRQQIVD